MKKEIILVLTFLNVIVLALIFAKSLLMYLTPSGQITKKQIYPHQVETTQLKPEYQNTVLTAVTIQQPDNVQTLVRVK